MTGKYRAYPEYKDSGVEWLKEIPCDWHMWKIAHACQYVASGTTPKSDSDTYYGGENLWVTTGELREGVIFDTLKKVTDKALVDMPTLRLHPAGSVSIAMYGATIGRLGIFGKEAATNQACCVLPPSANLYNKYLFYWLYATRQEIINLSSGGGQPNVNQEKIASLKVSCPDYKLQEKIANFLDHETAKIDTLIEKQQQLIQLLKEKRQAVISHAVTKGLSSLNGGPNAKMRDSGVEWLGEVPEHWKVSPIKWYSSIKSGENLPANEIESIKDEEFCYPVYGGNGILGYAKKSNLKTTAIVIGRVGALCGNVHKTEELSWISDNALILNVNASVFSFDYIALCLEVRDLNKLADKNAQPLITGTKVTNEYVPIPPVDEQREIEGRVIGMMRHFEVLSSQAETGIALLQERRTALISAAVTGKIDVRDWVAPQTSPTHKEVAA
jgi:type I restriction enzyme S subunit